jgi:septal ring factor EnvC (AmiA/AmiB activator)
MDNVLNEIRELSGRLIEDRKRLQQLLVEKEEELERVNALVSKHEKRNAELEAEIKNLKIAKSLNGTGESTDAKLKINELVREIDRCIALLNT